MSNRGQDLKMYKVPCITYIFMFCFLFFFLFGVELEGSKLQDFWVGKGAQFWYQNKHINRFLHYVINAQNLECLKFFENTLHKNCYKK